MSAASRVAGVPRRALGGLLMTSFCLWGAREAVDHFAGSRAPAHPAVGTVVSDVALPAPLAEVIAGPATSVMDDFDAYVRFLRDTKLADSVLVAWVITPGGTPLYTAVLPLNDQRTFSNILRRRPALRAPPRVLRWPAETLASRDSAQRELARRSWKAGEFTPAARILRKSRMAGRETGRIADPARTRGSSAGARAPAFPLS